MICLDYSVSPVFFPLKAAADIKLIRFLRPEMPASFIPPVVSAFVFSFDSVLTCLSLLACCVPGFFLSLSCIGFETRRDLEIHDFGSVPVKHLSAIFPPDL